MVGHRPGPWGWHRLAPAWADRLVADASVAPGDLVLDIGAGTGALTAPLVAAGARVVAVELHPGRAAALRRRFAGADVTVVRADAADLRLPRRPFRVVANPPFGVTTAVLAPPAGAGVAAGVRRPGAPAGRGAALGRGPGAGRGPLVPGLPAGRRPGRAPLGVLAPPGRAVRGAADQPSRARPALTAAPSSQQASRSARVGVPVIESGGWAAFHRSPVTMRSRAARAPVVSSLPWTYTP